MPLASLTTLIGTISASGATPTVPTPFAVAAMIPATNVPCENVVPGGGVTGSPGTNDRGSAAWMLGARSGCVTSKLVSSTATRTPAPVKPASQAALACTAWRPHWKGKKDSSAGESAGPTPSPALVPSPTTGSDTLGTTEETPGIAAPAVRKLASAATTKVPRSGYARTRVPPSGAIASWNCCVGIEALRVTTSQV